MNFLPFKLRVSLNKLVHEHLIGKPRVAHFQPIVDRIKEKLSTWKGSLLNGMGSIGFHIYSWPIASFKSIDRWIRIRNFVWFGDIHTRKFVTMVRGGNLGRAQRAGPFSP